jgi:two-component system NarL family sensor kinase
MIVSEEISSRNVRDPHGQIGSVGAALDALENPYFGIMPCEWDIRADERERIARDLHDGTAQLLVSLQLSVALLKAKSSGNEVAAILLEIDETIQLLHREIRMASVAESAVLPNISSLGEALDEMGRAFGRATGTRVKVESALARYKIPADVKSAFYRIAQEALANARRHGDADCITIRLTTTRNRVRLIVEDNGRGFDPTASTGTGLVNMRRRLRPLGGNFAVDHLANGTRLTASVPIQSMSNSDFKEAQR